MSHRAWGGRLQVHFEVDRAMKIARAKAGLTPTAYKEEASILGEENVGGKV